MKDRRSPADADPSPAASTFLRGLSLGALVGAAIAGSALLQRRRRLEAPASGGEMEATPGGPREPRPADPGRTDG